jgi:hypothetical protein
MQLNSQLGPEHSSLWRTTRKPEARYPAFPDPLIL